MAENVVSLITNPPPLLLEELVLSADPIADVALRHNVDPDVLQLVMDHPVFSAKLATAKSHHEKTGEYQRTLARHRFIEALDNAHFKALDPRTSPKDAIAYMESLATIGEIKRSTSQAAGEGSAAGFVFNIHFSGGKTVSIDAVNNEKVIEGEFTNTSAAQTTPTKDAALQHDDQHPPLPTVNVQSDEFEFTE